MILVASVWLMIFFICFVTGFSVFKLICSIGRINVNSESRHLDEYFFLGFLILSLSCGYLSIWIPIGIRLLLYTCLLSIVLFILNFKDILYIINASIKKFSSLKKSELILILLLLLLLLAAIIQRVTWYDTGLYHAQSIQWIQKYPVVPGLGNIHGRIATNSMFFVISGLFTFKINDILLFPLNGICYVVLVIKLLTLSSREHSEGRGWLSMMYGLIVLVSLMIMIPTLNSASPDLICAILIIYTFLLLINNREELKQLNLFSVILLNLIVFSCATFKISSLFLIISLLFYFNKQLFVRSIILIIIGFFVFLPYFIRNYYLSGYLIYPLPSIDIFNVDWKIPLEKAIDEKAWIVNWAKISGVSYHEVINLKMSEWIGTWFKNLTDNNRIFIMINSFSIFILIIMVLKKDYFWAVIQSIIIINLAFWFLMAPDPRFAYGFIILGFSLTIAYFFKMLEYSRLSVIPKYFSIALTISILSLIIYNKHYAVSVFKNYSLILKPMSYEIVETRVYNSGFDYRMPVNNEDRCFNTEIPCVPYPISNIVLRGTDLRDGFKVVKNIH